MLRILSIIPRYLKYRWRAVNAHGLHSPFLFDVYNKLIKVSDQALSYQLKLIRKEVSKLSTGKLEFTNPKTGIREKKNLRSFIGNSTSSHRFSIFLSRLVDYLGYDRLLETGTCAGINTIYLAHSKASKIYTIEGMPEIAKIAQKHFDRLKLNQITLISGLVQEKFEMTLSTAAPQMIFLDADHRSETIRFYLEKIQLVHPQTQCIIIHDIHWSADMEQIWNEIIQKQEYALTIDIFQAGIIFPHHPMRKQHFVIRF